MDDTLNNRVESDRRRLLAGLACASVAGGAWSGAPDLLIRGGSVIDGSGRPAYRADVAVRGGRIAAISRQGARSGAARTLDAAGLVVAPGFIDMHAHVSEIDRHPAAENFLRQGVTTIFNSLHSLDLPWPLDRYGEALRVGPNVVYVAGHNWARKAVLGAADRAPTPTELARMVSMVDQAMAQGAVGLGTGLEYIPSAYAKTDEVVALARAAARRGGFYVTHLRDEGPRVIEAMEEALSIGRRAGLPVHINHHKVTGRAQWGWSRRTLALIDKARADGVDVSHDLYPYAAYSTVSDVLFPAWALADGPAAFVRRVSDPAVRTRLIAEMRTIFPQQTGEGLDSVQFREVAAYPAFAGKTLADLLAALGRPETLEAAIDLLIDLQSKGGFIGIFHAMSEEDIRRIMLHPSAMVCSDADLVEPGVGFPHPRSYGAFPRVLQRYVREQNILTLEAAVHKMTAMPAARLGLRDRGLLRQGRIADLTIFDPRRIADRSTYTDPHHYPVGVEHLVVAGQPVIVDGRLTGARPGRALLRRRRG